MPANARVNRQPNHCAARCDLCSMFIRERERSIARYFRPHGAHRGSSQRASLSRHRLTRTPGDRPKLCDAAGSWFFMTPQLARTYIREPLRTLSLGCNTQVQCIRALFLRIAYTAVSGRDYSVVATVSPTLRAAGLSGKGQNTEHGCGYGD